ncbi:MAG: type IV toxin-antitoxin system AbiEi family antitoxin domain-containing protein [Acidimicrobiia bacterium]|nr:type IV toxin-antitoxin system AbiEi family antitoxin domain-containing protein [Acidimicrobiia bacterium]
MLADTYRRRLFDRALDQYGYVTTENARDLGIPPVELRKLAARGGLEPIAYGVYRFEDVPRTPLDHYMEAVLRVGDDAYLTGDAVLALHDLALVNPRRVRVGTRRRARPKLPATIELVKDDVEDDEITSYEGIPAVTVARALRDCRSQIMGDRFLDAINSAERRGLLRRDEAAHLRAESAGEPT